MKQTRLLLFITLLLLGVFYPAVAQDDENPLEGLSAEEIAGYLSELDAETQQEIDALWDAPEEVNDGEVTLPEGLPDELYLGDTAYDSNWEAIEEGFAFAETRIDDVWYYGFAAEFSGELYRTDAWYSTGVGRLLPLVAFINEEEGVAVLGGQTTGAEIPYVVTLFSENGASQAPLTQSLTLDFIGYYNAEVMAFAQDENDGYRLHQGRWEPFRPGSLDEADGWETIHYE